MKQHSLYVWSWREGNFSLETSIFLKLADKLLLIFLYLVISSVQSLSHVQLFVTPWTAALEASLSITNSWSLLKLMSIELVMPSNQSHPLSPSSLPAPNLSQHQGLFQCLYIHIWVCMCACVCVCEYVHI